MLQEHNLQFVDVADLVDKLGIEIQVLRVRSIQPITASLCAVAVPSDSTYSFEHNEMTTLVCMCCIEE